MYFIIYIKILKITQPNSPTLKNEREALALSGEVLMENIVVINTAVVPLVGGLCSSKPEEGRVIDSWQGVAGWVRASEHETEGTSGVLWLHEAVEREAVALDEQHILLLLVIVTPRRNNRPVGRKQDVCRQRQKLEL